MNRLRGGLVLKAHRLVCHSTLGLRVIKKKRRNTKRETRSAEPLTLCTGLLRDSLSLHNPLNPRLKTHHPKYQTRKHGQRLPAGFSST